MDVLVWPLFNLATIANTKVPSWLAFILTKKVKAVEEKVMNVGKLGS